MTLSVMRSAAARVSSSLRGSERVSGRRRAMGASSAFFDLGLRLDDVQHLIFQNHTNQHLAFLRLAILDSELRNVLARLLGELFEAFFDFGVADLERFLLRDLGHEQAGGDLELAVGTYFVAELVAETRRLVPLRPS